MPVRPSRPIPTSPALRAWLLLGLCLGAILGLPGVAAAATSQASYAPGTIVVRVAATSQPRARAASAGASRQPRAARTLLVRLSRGESVPTALRRLRAQPGVQWAVPDYMAHAVGSVRPAAGGSIPNDPGEGTERDGWQRLQWNFTGPFSVHAPEAWANLEADGAAGGQGVRVAVLDTGVAYANRGRFRRSPDFSGHTFVQGYDFVNKDPYPNDRNGHGTFVASTIAEAVGNGYGLTGLAFAAQIMPVRVLDTQGEGEASTIAEGVLFAVRHGAQVINLSLEFSPGVTTSDIPELLEAIRYADRHGVLVVAAAGNEGHAAIAYPARAPDVVSVGATTEHGCLAAYSNDGAGLTLVAPGGGADASLPGDPNCRPELPAGRDVYQVTLTGSSPRRFGLPSGYEGTSMATPHVAATAALIIASRVLGRHPSPAQITARLRATATRLGGGGDEGLYGAGLANAAAATAPGGPGALGG